MEAKRLKVEAKSILKKSGKYLYNQDGTPVLVNGQYLYLNDDGTTTLLGNHPDFDCVDKELPRIAEVEREATEEEEAEPLVAEGERGVAETESPDANWDVKSTRLLLSLYKVMRELVERRKIPTLKRMWATMAGRLHEHGYTFTPYQVENRYKTLQRSYRRKVEGTGARRGPRLYKDVPYERELKEIYEKEKKSPDMLVNTGGEQISIADFLEATGLGGQRQAQFVAGTSRSRPVLTLTPEMAAKLRLKRPAAAASPAPAPPPPAYFTNHSRRSDVMEELRDLRSNTLEKLRAMEDKRDAFNEKVLQELRYRNDLLEKLLEHVP